MLGTICSFERLLPVFLLPFVFSDNFDTFILQLTQDCSVKLTQASLSTSSHAHEDLQPAEKFFVLWRMDSRCFSSSQFPQQPPKVQDARAKEEEEEEERKENPTYSESPGNTKCVRSFPIQPDGPLQFCRCERRTE